MKIAKSITAIATLLLLGVSPAWASDAPNGVGGVLKQKTPEQSRITMGETTKTRIRELCGEPASSKATTSGEMWSYFYGNRGSLDLNFNETGVVVSYQINKGSSENDKIFRPVAGEKPGAVNCSLCPIYCPPDESHSESYICGWYSCLPCGN